MITSSNVKAVEGKGLSPEAQKWIGVGALLACLLVGAGVVYFLVLGSAPRKRTVTVDPKQQSMGVDGRLPIDVSRRDMPGVHATGADSWLVRGKSGGMRVVRQKGEFKFTFDFGRGFVPQDQVPLLAALVRAQTDGAMAKQWGITPEQVAKLKKVNFRQGLLNPSAQDRASLASLWGSYHVADGQAKVEAQKRLVEKLDAVAKANLDDARKALSDRMEAARSILGEAALKKLTAG
jgi:hypothetical protein